MEFYTGSGGLITIENAASGILKKAPWDTVIHRGWVAEVKENTLPAMWLTKEKGYDWAECDIRCTSDGIPVLVHNSTIVSEDGSTTLNVTTSTLEQLKTVTLQTHERFGVIKMPTLAELLEMARLIDLNILLDIKTSSVEQSKTIARVVLASGWSSHVVYMPGSTACAQAIAAIDTNASFDFVSSYTTVDTLPDLAAYTALLTGGNTVGFDLNGAGADAETLAAIRAAGLSVSFWNVTTGNYNYVMDAGPLRITKNNGADKTDLDKLYLATKTYW